MVNGIYFMLLNFSFGFKYFLVKTLLYKHDSRICLCVCKITQKVILMDLTMLTMTHGTYDSILTGHRLDPAILKDVLSMHT